MTLNSFARGRTVYGNGSFAPTRGPVSAQGAMGYLQREMRKPKSPVSPHATQFAGASTYGADGQSDTRSGIAAGMMRKAKDKKKPKPKPKPPKGGGSEPKRPYEPEPQEPVIPVVKINENGTLDLPYNDEWSQAVLQAYQSMNNELLGINAEANQQALDYSMANRNLDQQYGGVRRETLNDNASRGMLFSSGYGQSVANNARDFNNAKNDLAVQNTQMNNNFGMERTAIQNAFNEMIRQNILQQARDEAADADHEAPVQPKPPKKPDNRPNKPKPKPSKGKRPNKGKKPDRRRRRNRNGRQGR